MVSPTIAKPKGILNEEEGRKHFRLALHPPAPDLSFFVDHFWLVNWDMPDGLTYEQQTLPYPCVHLVFESRNTGIYGVIKKKFTRRLEGRGQVVGMRFRPGAFYPFLNRPVSKITNSTLDFREVFGFDNSSLEEAIFALDNKWQQVELTEEFIRAHLPPPDDNVELVNQVVDLIINNPTITRVEGLGEVFGLSKRTLQRLFSQYVGVSPKWVIQRYRLQEATERLAQGEPIDWAKLATELGYFDQAHFIKDFKGLIGQTPADYAKSLNGLDNSFGHRWK